MDWNAERVSVVELAAGMGFSGAEPKRRGTRLRILITFAVDAEFAPWRKLKTFVAKTNGISSFQMLQVGNTEIDILLTGIGGKTAWLETTKRVWDGDIDICISSGLAGGLKTNYHPGAILAARAVQAVSWGKTVSCDPDLLRIALETGAQEAELFYSTDRVILTAKEKRELGRKADAVEMESGEVLYEAQAFGARTIAIRGISDTVEEDLPLDFNRVTTATGEVSLTRVMGEVLMHPGAIPSLMRFGKQSKMAAEKLCQFLDGYVQKLASSATLNSQEVITK
jgi:adenosylhomocysteine nucleosidase